jgi:hypothetical protein
MSSPLEGLSLFAGLNVVPKRSPLTESRSRVESAFYPEPMRDWFEAVSRLGLKWGTSFDLDFHTIPFDDDDPLVETHSSSRRSRRQKGRLAFLAQDADTRVFCAALASRESLIDEQSPTLAATASRVPPLWSRTLFTPEFQREEVRRVSGNRRQTGFTVPGRTRDSAIVIAPTTPV